MKPFQTFINESFMISRKSMPQIEDVFMFIQFLDNIYIENSLEFGYVDQFKPTQAEGFDEDKVQSICMDMRNDPDSNHDMKPIIVSNDDFVLDGHHRLLAAQREKERINYLYVNLPINKLLKVVYDYLEN